MKASAENVEYCRALWHSLCPSISPPTEDEVAHWLGIYPMRYVVHAIKITLRENDRYVQRGQSGLQEDEAITRCLEIMQSELDGFEQRRAA